MEALPRQERNYSGESLHSGSALTVETYYINDFDCNYSNGYGRNNGMTASKSMKPIKIAYI